jgi:hypothetical protein|tara:strand:- start:2572 stop:2793 length:222 start_codon:yes stop_codon:yes gene_type:complete
MTTSWGYFQQGSNQLQTELEELGARLSQEIACPVHYPAYGKKVFECRCHVLFPHFFVQGNDWTTVRKHHEEGA